MPYSYLIERETPLFETIKSNDDKTEVTQHVLLSRFVTFDAVFANKVVTLYL